MQHSGDKKNTSLNEPEAEIAGIILKYPELLDEILLVISEDDFATHAYREIVIAAKTISRERRPLGIEQFVQQLKRQKAWDDLGEDPHSVLADLVVAIATGAGWYPAAEAVRSASLSRRIASTLYSCNNDLSEGKPPEYVLEDLESAMLQLSKPKTADTIASAKAGIHSTYDVLDRRRQKDPSVRPISSGFPRLDEVLNGGLTPSQMIVLAARTGQGKTALALNFMQYASRCGFGSLYVTLEMPKEQICERVMASVAGIPATRIKLGTITQDEADKIMAARLDESLWMIDDYARNTVSRIASNTRRLVRQGKIQMLIVDYLQLIKPENPKDNRERQVGEISTALKQLAMDCSIPVVALAQLNRSSARDPKQEPILADLRDSGQVEQDADVVMFLHSPDFDWRAESNRVDLLIRKNRHGTLADVPMIYSGSYLRFAEDYSGLD